MKYADQRTFLQDLRVRWIMWSPMWLMLLFCIIGVIISIIAKDMAGTAASIIVGTLVVPLGYTVHLFNNWKRKRILKENNK